MPSSRPISTAMRPTRSLWPKVYLSLASSDAVKDRVSPTRRSLRLAKRSAVRDCSPRREAKGANSATSLWRNEANSWAAEASPWEVFLFRATIQPTSFLPGSAIMLLMQGKQGAQLRLATSLHCILPEFARLGSLARSDASRRQSAGDIDISPWINTGLSG